MSFAGRTHFLPTGIAYSMAPVVLPVVHMPMMQIGTNNFNRQKGLLPLPASTDGPSVTVFVGNISERIPDPMITQILHSCGQVVSWKKVSTFGFCEYSNPESGVRCVRLLHEKEIGGKSLVVKVDGKALALVDTYKSEQRSKLNDVNNTMNKSGVLKDDYLDDYQRTLDENIVQKIDSIIHSYKDIINNYEAIEKSQQLEKTARLLQEADIEEEKLDVVSREIGKFRETMKQQEEMRVKSKREKDREGSKEREKEKDREKEVDRRKEREERDTDRRKERDAERSERGSSRRKERDGSRRKSRSRSRDRDREREREREREKEREREREREKEKERERERERERDREREREREREAERERSRGASTVKRDRDRDDDERERLRRRDAAREKEAAYQDRLRKWESRERRCAKEYAKERERDMCRDERSEHEAKRLKEFLEDYDDERDDPKYYKGKELQRRLAKRVREAENDALDRQMEKEDMEKLRREIFGDKPENDPFARAQYEQVRREQEDLYVPKILIDVNLEQSIQREKEEQRARQREEARKVARERELRHREKYLQNQVSRQLPEEAEPIESESSNASRCASPAGNDWETTPPHQSYGGSTPPMQPNNKGTSNENSPMSISMNLKQNHHNFNNATSPQVHFNDVNNMKNRKRKLGVHEIFNNEDSDDDGHDSSNRNKHDGKRRQPLVPIDYEEKEKKGGGGIHSDDSPLHSPNRNSSKRCKHRHRRHHHHHYSYTGSGNMYAAGSYDDNTAARQQRQELVYDHANKEKSKEKLNNNTKNNSSSNNETKIQEDKRKCIKSLIEKIPTAKEDLFAFKLDTSQIDPGLMEKKIRPWINKKIIEYIGEPEPTLVDFICSKVIAGSQPQSILDDVQMVLDEEAEVFVVKMWRLLIYEVEAKKMGLAK